MKGFSTASKLTTITIPGHIFHQSVPDPVPGTRHAVTHISASRCRPAVHQPASAATEAVRTHGALHLPHGP